MMAAFDPPIHERVYGGLKADYLAGDFIPGKRIDLQDLADRHRSSKTPVREAAFILVGEGLFRHHADGGFVVPTLDVPDLIEMHEWHLQLVLAAVLVLDGPAIQSVLQEFPGISGLLSPVQLAALTGDFFTSLAAATRSTRASVDVRRLNDHLHYYRIAEFAGAKNARTELKILLSPSARDLRKVLRRRLITYHRRKILALQRFLR